MRSEVALLVVAGLAIGIAFVALVAYIIPIGITKMTTSNGVKNNDNADNLLATSFYDSYPGINQTGEGLVNIHGHQYYFNTLDNITIGSDVSKNTVLHFHGVTFSFPDGSLPTPGGIFIIPAFQFQDGSYEKTGQITTLPDGSSSLSGRILIPSSPHPTKTNMTVLSHHKHPQVGVTVFDKEKIKLLVGTS